MVVFSWIFLGLTGLMLVGSGIAWGLSVVMDDSAWQKLGLKVFRLSMVVLLFYVNGVIYVHIVRVFRGEPPVVAVEIPSGD